jgi:hypothetical protein
MPRNKCVMTPNIINFDLETYSYETNNTSYATYAEARLHRWTCEKCNNTFGSLISLRDHKGYDHSY